MSDEGKVSSDDLRDFIARQPLSLRVENGQITTPFREEPPPPPAPVPPAAPVPAPSAAEAPPAPVPPAAPVEEVPLLDPAGGRVLYEVWLATGGAARAHEGEPYSTWYRRHARLPGRVRR